MREFQLSTPKERLGGISFSVVMIACFGLLLYAVRKDPMLLAFCALGGLLLTVLMVFYIVSILKSRCILDPAAKQLQVLGNPTYTRDLSTATLVETLPRKNGHATTRVVVFSDAEGEIVAIVPTLFTYKQGALADPMAREMAEALGIEFRANVPAWHYDKEAFKQYQIEEAEREKRERAERRERLRKKLLYRYRKGK